MTPGYFEAIGIPIRLGRDFSWRDGAARESCALNEALVHEYRNDENHDGRRLGQGRDAPADFEIIGVFGNSRYHDVRDPVQRQTFVNLDSRIDHVGAVTVYARIQGDPRHAPHA